MNRAGQPAGVYDKNGSVDPEEELLIGASTVMFSRSIRVAAAPRRAGRVNELDFAAGPGYRCAAPVKRRK